MRVLLDEHLDHRLRHSFASFIAVSTVAERGWKGKKNGELLQLASREFDALITMDRSLEYQQHAARHRIGIVLLRARSNRLQDTQVLIPQVCQVLQTLQPGTVIHVSASPSPAGEGGRHQSGAADANET